MNKQIMAFTFCISILATNATYSTDYATKPSTLNDKIGNIVKNTVETTAQFLSENCWTITVVAVGSCLGRMSYKIYYACAKAEQRFTPAFGITQNNKLSSPEKQESINTYIKEHTQSTYPLSAYIKSIDNHLWYLKRARTVSRSAEHTARINGLINQLNDIKILVLPQQEYLDEQKHLALCNATQYQQHVNFNTEVNPLAAAGISFLQGRK